MTRQLNKDLTELVGHDLEASDDLCPANCLAEEPERRKPYSRDAIPGVEEGTMSSYFESCYTGSD